MTPRYKLHTFLLLLAILPPLQSFRRHSPSNCAKRCGRRRSDPESCENRGSGR